MVTNQSATTGAIIDTKEDLIKANQGQLLDGMGSDGLPLPEYRDINKYNGYGAYKYAKNPRNEGRYDMYDTGNSFYEMYANVQGNEVLIGSGGLAQGYDNGTNINAPFLKGKIFGLSKGIHLENYQGISLYPRIRQVIRQETGL